MPRFAPLPGGFIAVGAGPTGDIPSARRTEKPARRSARTPAEPPPVGPLRRKPCRRTHLLAQDADEIVAAVPEPGEACHLLMSGRYHLQDVISLVVKRYAPCASLRIATLSLSQATLTDLLALYDAGTVADIRLVCSYYFTTAEPATYARLVAEFAARNLKAAAPRCHAKVVAMHFADGRKLVVEGSANLRSNKNFEQLAVIADPDLCDWHARWIDTVIGRHEAARGD